MTQTSIVVDTHVLIWYLLDDTRLSKRANEALDGAVDSGRQIYFPTMCLVEATYLVEKKRVAAEVVALMERAAAIPRSALEPVPLTMAIAIAMRQIPRDAVPDLPDRVIAATALALGLPLITRDGKIRASNIETIW
jgi:PIN domain nuclease of toxin-antitoxin system